MHARSGHLVIHRDGDPQTTLGGRVGQLHERLVVEVLLRDQRLREHRRRTRICLLLRHRFVRHEFRLEYHVRRSVQRLHRVVDRPDGALGERHQPGGGEAHRATGRRTPLDLAAQYPGPQIQFLLVRQYPAAADVERLVVDEQADDLAVGDVDDRLAGIGVPVSRFGVRHRPHLVHTGQVAAGQPVRIALVEVAAPAEVPVGEREQRFALGQDVQIEARGAQAPRFDRESGMSDHADVLPLAGAVHAIGPLSPR